MSGLQNENGLHTNDSLTLVVYVKPGKSIKEWCFVHLLNRRLFVFAQLVLKSPEIFEIFIVLQHCGL